MKLENASARKLVTVVDCTNSALVESAMNEAAKQVHAWQNHDSQYLLQNHLLDLGVPIYTF